MFMFVTFVGLLIIIAVNAEYPIIELKPVCPPSNAGSPGIRLISDVPAYGLALCYNGAKPLISKNKALHALQGTFDQDHSGQDCIFHYTETNNSFTVQVEVGWGETDQSESRSRIHVISCTYDTKGKLEGSTQTVSDWQTSSKIHTPLLEKAPVTTNIQLKVLDESDNDVTWSTIPVGKKIRLMAYDVTAKADVGFRPLGCAAQNVETSYLLLTDGCGDGFVLDKTVGFKSNRNKVYSPYFDSFRLKGDNSLHFVCNFTICPSACGEDSCLIQTRIRREISEDQEKKIQHTPGKIVLIESDPIHTAFMETKIEPARKVPNRPVPSNDISDFLLHLGSLARGYPSHPDPEVLQRVQHQSLKMELFITLTVFGVILLSTFVFSLYLCCKYEVVRHILRTN